MSRRVTHSYLFLIAVIPVLRLAAAYPGWADLADVAVILAAVLAITGLAYVLVSLALRRRDKSLAALIVLGLVLAFWGYVRVATLVESRTGWPHAVLLTLWGAATVGIIWWLGRRPALLHRAETFLTLSSGMLVVWFLFSIGVAQFRSARGIRNSQVVRQLAEPIQRRQGAVIDPRRDIYLLILDEYANAEVTGHLLGFDNHIFLDSLRQLGFVVPAVHSNYAHTFLSLPSLLNAAHLADLSKEVGKRSVNRTVPDYLVKHNRVVPFLKSQGYQYVLVASHSWEATRDDPRADRVVEVWDGWDPGRELTRSDLRGVLKKTSLLQFWKGQSHPYFRGHVTRSLAVISRVPEIPEPTFTFAHLMTPHSPYVFDRNCRPAGGEAPGRSRLEREGAPYVEQIECLNQMLLELVTTLLRESELPPVILLQGDHGSKLLRFDQASSAEAITLPAARERLGAFGAYYLPDRGSKEFGDSVTIVNVMGNVLRAYFGAELPSEPDDMYLSVDRAPYDFKRVDFTWLNGGGSDSNSPDLTRASQ